jgi:hypothetical protein
MYLYAIVALCSYFCEKKIMILSYANNFLFIKTRKTAGTSIEIALSIECSKKDVITPISPNDEIIRKRLLGLLPRNFSSSAKLEEAYRNAIIHKDIDRINSSRKLVEKRQIYWNHISADLIKKTVPSGI